LLEANAHAVLVRFEVRDSGIGIAEEAINRLFQSFSQADGSTTRKYGGTGLGLVISKQLTQMMDGEIGVDSKPGTGSTFWFTARFARNQDALGAGGEKHDLRGLPILLVEDNASSAEALQMLLLAWNTRVRCVFGAEAAVRVAQQAEAAGQRFGLVITDRLEAPKDAFWLMHQICNQPALKDTPVILLSSKRLKPFENVLGFVNQVAKPVRRAVLWAAIRATQEPVRSEGALRLEDDSKRSAKAESKESGLKILVVEDNPVNSVRFLEQHGHSVWAATSGEEALALFNRQLFDAILMDIQMPDIDGFEVTRLIRKVEPTERRVPVIATTAHALEGDRERCLAAGMDDYLTKPLQFAELLTALARVAHQSTALGQEQGATPPEPVEAK